MKIISFIWKALTLVTFIALIIRLEILEKKVAKNEYMWQMQTQFNETQLQVDQHLAGIVEPAE